MLHNGDSQFKSRTKVHPALPAISLGVLFRLEVLTFTSSLPCTPFLVTGRRYVVDVKSLIRTNLSKTKINPIFARHSKAIMFSKACEYGIRASIFLMGESLHGRKASLRDVAAAIDSPEAYTSKILQQLVRSNLIRSEKGPTGGFLVDPQMLDRFMLSDIVSAIDGDDVYKNCGLGLKQCNERKPCPVHFQFKAIREDLKNMLENTTVKSLAIDLSKGLTFLKR